MKNSEFLHTLGRQRSICHPDCGRSRQRLLVGIAFGRSRPQPARQSRRANRQKAVLNLLDVTTNPNGLVLRLGQPADRTAAWLVGKDARTNEHSYVATSAV